MTGIRYGNTNTFFIPGRTGGLLVDTDWAGTLPLFFRAIKAAGVDVKDISFLLATHYHPDHMGLAGELMGLGVKLLLMDVQQDHVHFADAIFRREKGLRFTPVKEEKAQVLRCQDSRAFLRSMGIDGEILHTPSHSPDSVSLCLDAGDCIVGDLAPLGFLPACHHEEYDALRKDWAALSRLRPRRIWYAHANETTMTEEDWHAALETL